MSKFGKTLLAVTAIGAVAAGTYYYIKKKNGEVPKNMGEKDVEFAADGEAKRSYVNLDFKTVEEKAKETAGKVVDVAKNAGNSIGSFVTQAEGKVEEFFNDKKEEVADAVDEAAEAVAEVSDAVEETAENIAEAVAEEVKAATEE